MSSTVVLKSSILLIVMTLSLLIAFKPRINASFHASYLQNAWNLNALPHEVVRQQLLVRSGQIKHYDFLEASMQALERSVQLARIVPEHTGEGLNASVQEWASAMEAGLEQMRADVELSKRAVGLLSNSRKAVSALMRSVNAQLVQTASDNTDAEVASQMALALKLHERIAAEERSPEPDSLLLKMQQSGIVSAETVSQLILHLNIIDEYRAPLSTASERLYRTVTSLDEVRLIRDGYTQEHEAAATRLTWQLWATYLLAACLVLCALLLARSASRASADALDSQSAALQARQKTEEKIKEIERAVIECNRALERLSQGDFSSRIDESFSEELEELRHAINRTADRVQHTMQELENVMVAMRQGQFDREIATDVTGAFRQEVEQTTQSLKQTITEICVVMDAMHQGDFEHRIATPMSGSFDHLKSTINSSMDTLSCSLSDIGRVVQSQADGDFSQRVEPNWPGQLGTLSLCLNRTADKVYAMVVDIHSLSRNVTEASHIMLNNAQALKEQTDLQVKSTNDAFAIVEEVRELIVQNRESTNSATELASRSEEEAEAGVTISAGAITAMQAISEKSEEIKKITATMERIASQTSLLSLNASVEAARANEHGKGFAVVAGEVKALAHLSADASATIGKIIESSDAEVHKGEKSVKNTSKALGMVCSSIVSVRDISTRIAAVSNEQAQGIDRVTETVAQIDRLTRNNQQMADRTWETSENLDQLARQMAVLVSFFSVEAGETRRAA